MLLSNEFNFERITDTHVVIGCDFNTPLYYTLADGSPGNLTDDTLEMTIKDELGGAALAILGEVGDNTSDGLYIPTPTNGQVFIQIADTTSSFYSEGIYPYQITRVDVDSKKFIWMQGTIEFFNRGF
jgi:hypothetical protein